MIRSKQEVQEKIRTAKSKLTNIDLFKASRYRLWSFFSLAISIASALFFIGIGTNMMGFGTFIFIGMFLTTLFLGLSCIFHAKEGKAQGYFLGSSRGQVHSIFGSSVPTAARYYSILGYFFVIAAFAAPLIISLVVILFPHR